MMGVLKSLAVRSITALSVIVGTAPASYAKEPVKKEPVKQATTVQPLQAQGSRVIMDLPKAFVPAPRFVGFIDEKRQISFVIADFPAEAMAKMADGFNASKLQERGFLDPREGTLARTDTYIYRRFAQTSPNGLMQKFILVFGNGDATGMVSANVPTPLLSSGAVTEREIETMLVSARLATQKLSLPIVATLGDTASLKLALTYGQTQIWTVDGKSGASDVMSPSIILAASATYEPVAKPAQLAAAALTATAGHRNIALIGVPVSVTLGPHNGIELTATADAEKSDEPRALYQFLMPQADGGYIRFIGIAPRADKDLWFVAFRRSVKTIKLKD
jgi:hypothetical protein